MIDGTSTMPNTPLAAINQGINENSNIRISDDCIYKSL